MIECILLWWEEVRADARNREHEEECDMREFFFWLMWVLTVASLAAVALVGYFGVEWLSVGVKALVTISEKL